MALTLTSPAFEHGQPIPRRYTCEGDDISPPLEWTGIPEGTKSLALIVEDPDAPDPAAPKRVWVHWVLYDIPVNVSGLPEGAGEKDLPKGSREGLNDWKKVGYGGPCPPVGRHRYFHRLYALDTVLGDLGDVTKRDLLARIDGHVLGEAELVGTYVKQGR
ncbi:MAG: YbhB/YbcL family Raf kinase inhibitor-like protein [Planctomycetota bacterium]